MKYVLIAWAIFIAVVLLIGARRVAVKNHNERVKDAARDACDHVWWPTRWTQDGWTRICKVCGKWDYLGDDFETRPADAEDYGETGRG